MTFDYFNVSHLAFGSKITKAFTQLDRFCNEAEGNLSYLYQLLDIYGEFIDKNYPCPFPTRPDAPVRAKELFDLLNDANTLRKIYLDSEGDLHCEVVLYKRSSNRFTIATGQTDLKEGFVFCKDSVSNRNYSRNLQFVEDYNSGIGNFLFEFRIDEDNNINIVGDTYKYYIPSNFDHITSMAKDETIFTNAKIDNSSYTAESYECVLLVGYLWPLEDPIRGSEQSLLEVSINGKKVVDNRGRFCRQCAVVYLKPDDELKASCKTAFRIKYNSSEPLPPQPEPEPPVEPIVVETNIAQYSMYYYGGNTWHYDGTWSNSYGATETSFTGAFTNEEIGVSSGFAAAGLFTLSRAVTADDNYELSLNYNGTLINAFHSEEVTDTCRIFFIDREGAAISDRTIQVTRPGTEGGYTTATISGIAIPTGTKKIRIASMGFSYNSYQQRYYGHFGGMNITVQEPQQEEE